MTNPEKLVEKMTDAAIQYVEPSDAELMLRIVLQEIKDGGVVENDVCDGIIYKQPRLQPDYQKFMDQNT